MKSVGVVGHPGRSRSKVLFSRLGVKGKGRGIYSRYTHQNFTIFIQCLSVIFAAVRGDGAKTEPILGTVR